MARSGNTTQPVLGIILAFLRRRGHHLLFGIALLSLASLVIWWSVFIRTSISVQRELKLGIAVDHADALAVVLGSDQYNMPVPGVLEIDPRYEVVPLSGVRDETALRLSPYWETYAVQVSGPYLEELDSDYERKLQMVVGEGSFLGLIIIVSVFMLYRLMRMERRAARELQGVWNRLTHELKTPITGIKAFLQTIEKQEIPREDLVPLIRMALREVERQEMLAENLLIGQRMDTRTYNLKSKIFKLAQYVRDFREEHRIILPDEDLELDIRCAEDFKVSCDPEALWAILENLTDNALKYGGKHPHLKFIAMETEQGGAISVVDNGTGFDPRFAESIFEAYQRLNEELPEGRHGTGMGLYLSRQLARKMGGELKAYSEGLGMGAEFRVTMRKAK